MGCANVYSGKISLSHQIRDKASDWRIHLYKKYVIRATITAARIAAGMNQAKFSMLSKNPCVAVLEPPTAGGNMVVVVVVVVVDVVVVGSKWILS